MNEVVFFLPFSDCPFVEYSIYRITLNTSSVSRTLFSAEDVMRHGSESGSTLGMRLLKASSPIYLLCNWDCNLSREREVGIVFSTSGPYQQSFLAVVLLVSHSTWLLYHHPIHWTGLGGHSCQSPSVLNQSWALFYEHMHPNLSYAFHYFSETWNDYFDNFIHVLGYF